jgi:hypothetical protein
MCGIVVSRFRIGCSDPRAGNVKIKISAMADAHANNLSEATIRAIWLQSRLCLGTRPSGRGGAPVGVQSSLI